MMVKKDSPLFKKKSFHPPYPGSSKTNPDFQNSLDVLILGDHLESHILNQQLKARSFKTLLIELKSFPKLESLNPGLNPYNNFCSSFHPQDLYEMQFEKLKENPDCFSFKKFKSPLNSIQSSKTTSKINSKTISKAKVSKIEAYFHWLFENSKKPKIKTPIFPFFSLNRILHLYLKERDSHNDKRLKDDDEVSSFEFKKGTLSSVLLTSGEKISAPWIILSLSPRLLVHFVKKSIKQKKDDPFPSRVLSNLAKFRAWNQISLVFTHRWNEEKSSQLKKNEEKAIESITAKREEAAKDKLESAKFKPKEKKLEKEKKRKKIPQNHESLILNHGKRFCGGFFGESYYETEKHLMLRKSCWMSLIPSEEFENRKSLRKFVLSMKKQISNGFPQLFKKETLVEEVFLIEPESHGFLDIPFDPSFGCIKGAKNFLLSSALFSSLPPPLNAFESAKKTLDSLLSLISKSKKYELRS